MPELVPTTCIAIQRDGKNLYLDAGKSFQFTAAEVAEIRESDPALLRSPRNESVAVAMAAGPAIPDDPGANESSADGKGGKPKPDTTGKGGKGAKPAADDDTGGL